MRLEPDGAFRAVILNDRQNHVHRVTHDGGVVLNQHAVLKGGDVGGDCKFPVLKTPGAENDVKILPVAGVPGGVDERRVLAVNRSRCAIRVDQVQAAFKDLEFVKTLQV